MTRTSANRSRLMVGCGSAALALALVLASQAARAQAINASGVVTNGSAVIDNSVAGQTTIDVLSPTAVIDWTPIEDGGGNALTFLPTGTTALFQTNQLADFAVLNRILPATQGNITVFDGTVISQIVDGAGNATPGGFVAFYSPTGILVGSTATFDVGRLLLTTLDTTPASFDNFVTVGAFLDLAAPGSVARVQIDPGAQITATAENSFFAVVAADIEMLGTARINGSHAYVAGGEVSLSFSNGLFNIIVPTGTAVSGQAVRLDGTVGGPSSTGAVTDNHMIYAVARAAADPISMIFEGNLGFDPAASAGIVNGEIILSANYNVFGRSVNGDTISNGINASFVGNDELTDMRADIAVENFNATSTILAIGSHDVRVSAGDIDSAITGNLLVVGREDAEVSADLGQSLTIDGDVLVDARDYGVVGSFLATLDEANAVGGNAQMIAANGASIAVTGNALVTADALGGAEELSGTAGSAQGGQATIGSSGGTLNIDGVATISARGLGVNIDGIDVGAEARGGTARMFADQGGTAVLDQDLFVDASATGAQGDTANPSTPSSAFGGTASVAILTGGGTIDIGSDLFIDTGALALSSNASTGGATADAGVAALSVEETGTITVTGLATLQANAFAGDNSGGQGGQALGGAARAFTLGSGTISIGGEFLAQANAQGGAGTSGGDAFAGIAGANAITGTIELRAAATANAVANGGGADFGFGGDGGLGRGGTAFFQADGTAAQAAALTITGQVSIRNDGRGGDGGASDGATIAAGSGGDGFGGEFSTPNQADPTRNGGAFLLAGGDYGTLSVGGEAFVFSQGEGGRGGLGGGLLAPGRGGNGFGGLAQAGVTLLGGPGTVGNGSATYTDVTIDATGFGGTGGIDGQTDEPGGPAGDGTGGSAILSVRAGTVDANLVSINAAGTGGTGNGSGIGTGGNAAVAGGQSGTLNAASLNILAIGTGGFANLGDGGDGVGGAASIQGAGVNVAITDTATLVASGEGGVASNGTVGEGTGGVAFVQLTGADQLTASALNIAASGRTGVGGLGRGGLAALAITSGSTAVITATDITLDANAEGGTPGGANNAAGRFDIDIEGGTVNAQGLTARALGDAIAGDPAPSTLRADVGRLNVSGLLIGEAFGDIAVVTGQGGLIGSVPSASTTNFIDLTSQGTITIAGDNGANLGIGGDTIRFSARDIDIGNGSRIGARVVTITSLETAVTAVLGGTTPTDEGFVLTADELRRIAASELDIRLPEVIGTNDPDQPDVVIRDLTLDGTQGGVLGAVFIQVGFDFTGIARVEGDFAYLDAAPTDVLSLSAGERIEIVTPGGIRIEDSDGAPGGVLQLQADSVWAADAQTLAALRDDPGFAGRDSLLALAASGSDDPLGYIRAGAVGIGVTSGLLVRNTGTAFAPGGILVGEGGLSISARETSQSGPGPQLDVVAYGRRQTATGDFVTGAAFFEEVNFNRVSPGETVYLDASTFNDCVINTGVCPDVPPSGPEIEPPLQINNPGIFEPPLQIGESPPAVEGEEEERFGIDFPERPDAPLITEDPLLDDPVASGGDASVYGGSALPPEGGEK